MPSETNIKENPRNTPGDLSNNLKCFTDPRKLDQVGLQSGHLICFDYLLRPDISSFLNIFRLNLGLNLLALQNWYSCNHVFEHPLKILAVRTWLSIFLQKCCPGLKRTSDTYYGIEDIYILIHRVRIKLDET